MPDRQVFLVEPLAHQPDTRLCQPLSMGTSLTAHGGHSDCVGGVTGEQRRQQDQLARKAWRDKGYRLREGTTGRCRADGGPGHSG